MKDITIENLDENRKDNLRLIKKSFRQSMNADLSNSMRAHGFEYSLIFGVPAPRIKLIASEIESDMILAKYLWNENIRESKIIATYLFPLDEIDVNLANNLISDVKYTEIADYLSRNILQNLSNAKEIVSTYISSPNNIERYIGMRLFTLLFQKDNIDSLDMDIVFEEIKNNLCSNVSYLKSMSVNIADLLFEKDGETLKKAREFFSKYDDNIILKNFNDFLY